jgi:hypothetical protein
LTLRQPSDRSPAGVVELLTDETAPVLFGSAGQWAVEVLEVDWRGASELTLRLTDTLERVRTFSEYELACAGRESLIAGVLADGFAAIWSRHLKSSASRSRAGRNSGKTA